MGSGSILTARRRAFGSASVIVALAWAGSALAQPAAPGGAPAAPPAPAGNPPAAKPTWAEIRIIPPTERRTWEQRKANLVRNLASQPANGPAGDQFNEYFQLYMLPQFTHVDQLARTPALRDELAEVYINAARLKNGPVTDHLNGLVMDYMLAIARGPVRIFNAAGAGIDVLWNGDENNPVYWKLGGGGGPNNRTRGEIPGTLVARRGPPLTQFHPGCRYNAMLLIGHLNDALQLDARRVTAIGETPMGKALQPMLAIASDPKALNAVRLAAMVGIRRHVEKSKLTDNDRDLICAAMVRVLKEPLATGNLADGQQWMRRQAIGIVGGCRMDENPLKYSSVLMQRMTDPNETLPMREAAAAALALVQPAKQKPGEAADLATKLGELATDVARFELERAPQKQPDFSRRRAAIGFDSVVLGLGGKSVRQPASAPGDEAPPVGVLAGAPANEKPYVQGLIDRVSALRAACAKHKEAGAEAALREELQKGSEDISAFLAAGPEAAAAGAPAGQPTDGGAGAATKPANAGTQTAPARPETPMDVDPFGAGQ